MTGFLLTAKQKLMLCINKRLYRANRPAEDRQQVQFQEESGSSSKE